MLVALVVASVRLRPAIGVAAVVTVLAAVPIAPASFWNRMVSIFDQDMDETGSRQARIDLMHEAVRVFVANPVFGVGLGQFVNYDPTGRKEAWSVTHNATLQVAAELGVLGLVPFFYLIVRAGLAARTVRRALVPATRGVRRRYQDGGGGTRPLRIPSGNSWLRWPPRWGRHSSGGSCARSLHQSP